MKSKSINTVIFFAAVLLTVTQASFSQIRIGGIKVDGIKLPTTSGGNTKANPDIKTAGQETTSSGTKNGGDDPPEWWLKVIVGDIETAKGEVEIYTPEGRMYLVSSPLAPWLLRAVSKKAREEFAVDKKLNDWRKANANNSFDTALDALAASAAKKLPTYLPKASSFALRDAALEQMIKTKLKNAATVKTLKIGIMHSNWQIEKNDLGIPINRYREAFIWGKDSSDDHPYCHVYGFVIQQDYTGGGTYGSTGAYLNTDVLVGCPAN